MKHLALLAFLLALAVCGESSDQGKPAPPAESVPPHHGGHWYKVAEEGETVVIKGNVRFGTAHVYSTPLAVDGSVVATSEKFGLTFDATITKQLQSDSPAYASRHVKIMPLGDSITGNDGNGGWRTRIQSLMAARKDMLPVDFVGNAPLPYNNVPWDQDHNGYGGYRATNLLIPAGSGAFPGPHGPGHYYWGDARDLDDWSDGQAQDIVILHLGTNDLAGPDPSVTNGTILAGYSLLLAKARAANPKTRFVVAQIIGIGSAFAGADARVIALNAAIPAWAASNTTAASPVMVVDQHTGFDPNTMTSDGVHPNLVGASQMAERFLAALVPYVTTTGKPR